MPVLVNGERIPDEVIQREAHRLVGMAGESHLPEEPGRLLQLLHAAENAVVDQVLLRQQLERDERPINAGDIEKELSVRRAEFGCRTVIDEAPLRREIGFHLRMNRAALEFAASNAADLPEVADEDVRRFFEANRKEFNSDEVLHAAHIVRNVDETHSESDAKKAIEEALRELDRGAPFAEVADRYSDCKGNGGDLGVFRKGDMVPEFETAITALAPGQRTGIFRTPFGYHIAERRAAGAGSDAFESASREIRRFLVASRETEIYRRMLAGLRAKAVIEYLDDEPAAHAEAASK